MNKPILSNLKYAPGARKKAKRIGRGQGSGHGGTATRGHKGEGARSSTKFRPWFEGGQMPLVRRVPKFGFNNPFKKEYQIVNVGILEKLVSTGKLKSTQINPQNLYECGLVKKSTVPIKVLGNGELKSKLEVHVHAFSDSAIKKIESAGGKAIKI